MESNQDIVDHLNKVYDCKKELKRLDQILFVAAENGNYPKARVIQATMDKVGEELREAKAAYLKLLVLEEFIDFRKSELDLCMPEENESWDMDIDKREREVRLQFQVQKDGEKREKTRTQETQGQTKGETILQKEREKEGEMMEFD